MLNNIVNNIEQYRQQNIVQWVVRFFAVCSITKDDKRVVIFFKLNVIL